MSNHNAKDNLKAYHRQHSDKRTPKRSLLLSFIIFMAWVLGIGLLLSLSLSLIACQPNEPVIFVIRMGSL